MTDLQSLERFLPRARSQSGEDGADWRLRSKETVEHQIAEILREKIIVGVIARGQKLKQAEIARLLGVSITPVREALQLLEAQGYVAVRAHRGAICLRSSWRAPRSCSSSDKSWRPALRSKRRDG